MPWVTVIGVAKDVKQGGVDQATGTELYFLLELLPQIFPTISGPRLGDWGNDGSMNIVLRSALPMATLQPPIAAAVREADPSLPIAARLWMRCQWLRASASHADAPSAALQHSRSCSLQSGPTACSRIR